MAFFRKSPMVHRLCYFSIVFRTNQMGCGHFFDSLTFKHMAALKKKIQYVADHLLNYCFWQHAIVSKV